MFAALLLLSTFEPRFTKCPDAFKAEFHTQLDVSGMRPGWRGVAIDCEARAAVLGAQSDVLQRSWVATCTEPGCAEEARMAALLVTEMLKTEPAIGRAAQPQPQPQATPMQLQPPQYIAHRFEPSWVRGVRGGGIALTSVGGASLVMGLSLAIVGLIFPSRYWYNDTALIAGVGLIGAGAGMLGGGISMIVVAQRAKRRALLAPALYPGGGGFSFQGTF
jgi:hypothetical protein